jgi:predicted porin
MKKALLTAAIATAFAGTVQAQTSVSIGGVVTANVKSYNIGSSARATANEFRIDDDFNSRFWLTGSEDLGGGTSAVFYVENRLNSDLPSTTGTGNGLSNGDTWVGLRGSWGQVALGKFSWMSVQGLSTEFVNLAAGPGIASLLAMPTGMSGTYSILNEFNGAYLDVTRRSNAIQYRTPLLNGFIGTIGLSASSVLNEGNAPTVGGASSYSDGREIYLQGAYINGPLNLALGYRNNTAEGRPAAGLDDAQIRFSGHYVLPMNLKIGLQLDRAKRTVVGTGVSTSRTAWQIPVSYMIGNNVLLASYTRAGDTGIANTGAKMVTIGWEYAMSKRTNAGVYYSKLNNDAAGVYQPFLAGTSFTGSALVAGESASTFGVGIKHVF